MLIFDRIYIVTFNHYEYESWTNIVKAFSDREKAQVFINDQMRISKELREKLKDMSDKHMNNVDHFYVKLRKLQRGDRCGERLTVEENTEFHRLNKEHFTALDKVREDSGVKEDFIEDPEIEHFEIIEMEIE